MTCTNCGSDDLTYDGDGFWICLRCGSCESAQDVRARDRGVQLFDDLYDEGPQGRFDILAAH